MNIMTIAEALKKFEWEVLELSPNEFARWCSYFKIREEEETRERRKAEARASRAGKC